MNHTWIRTLSSLLLLPTLMSGQKAPTTATNTLTSSSTTLQLPGSLTLTSTIVPGTRSAGMATGSMGFFANGTISLGTVPLAVIPSTQTFPAVAQGSVLFGNAPSGLATFPSSTSKYSELAVVDSPDGYSEVTFFYGLGTSLLLQMASYSLSPTTCDCLAPNLVDSFAIADFNHDGVPDVLLHGYSNQGVFVFSVVPGKTSGATVGLDVTSTIGSIDRSGVTCGCSDPTEEVTIDDFNGDGYPDIAYATENGAGVTLNGGAGNAATFSTFNPLSFPLPAAGDFFATYSLASGHFTSSGHADLVVSGVFYTAAGALVSTSGSVILFPGNGDGTFGTPTSSTVGYAPTAVATASFRANKLTDVVVANQNSDLATGTIQVLFGDGKGNLSTSSTVNIDVPPTALSVADFNGDGFPDILVTGTDGSVNLLLNDGTGLFSALKLIATSPVSSFTAVGDFNGDGLPDFVQITKSPISSTGPSTISEVLNSASSQATLATAAQTLPAGTDVLTAVYAGDANFAKLASAGVSVAVTQTVPTLTWAPPAAMEYGTPLSATQLDAIASVPGVTTYSSPAGTMLPPGTNTVAATFVPTDAFDYAGATASQTIVVTAPSLTGISPSIATAGSAGSTITLTGQGFTNGAVVSWNGTSLATTWVNLGQLTAVVPAALLTTAGTDTITVTDPGKIVVSGTQAFTVVAETVVAQASASAMATVGQNSSVTLTVNSYPVPLTAILTLAFTPTAPNTVSDPSVLFPNNSTTDVIQIPANNSSPIPAIDFSSGSTAGTITITIQLVAGGTNVTPATLVPLTVSVPDGPPVITSATLTRTGTSMSVAILGLSPTRDMTSATFNFTAAPGKSLQTTTVTVDLTASFTGWYKSAASDTFGTTFLYTQPFTLNTDASDVTGISVTLTNSQGISQPATAQ